MSLESSSNKESRLGFSIRDIGLETNLVLAPMSGITNSAFRRLIKAENPGAVGLVVTEFISVEGLTRLNQRSLQMMCFENEERPLAVQIFGYDIERMAEAARMIEASGAQIIDINCGCPVPKVVKRGGGCELMRQADHLKRLLMTVRKAISVPLTLKMRIGWDADSVNCVELARLAQDCGVEMLAVHGRTRVQMYRGEADWGIIGRVRDAVSIPVVGSGDIVDAASAKRALESGVNGLMIGRGALANPWIFAELQAAFRGEAFEAPTARKIQGVLERYCVLLLEAFPERCVIGRMKQLASQAVRGIPGAGVRRKALLQSLTLPHFVEILSRWKDIDDQGYDQKPSEAAPAGSVSC